MILEIRTFDIRGKYFKISPKLMAVNPNHKPITPPKL
jgi:hypothetical protein